MKTEEETVSSIEESKLKRTSRYGEEHINGWYKLFISDDTLDHPDQLHDKKAKLSDPFFSADSSIINKTVKWAQRGASAHIEDGGVCPKPTTGKSQKRNFYHGTGCFTKHSFFGFSTIWHMIFDFTMLLDRFWYVLHSFLLNYWSPVVRCSMKLPGLLVSWRKEEKKKRRMGGDFCNENPNNWNNYYNKDLHIANLQWINAALNSKKLSSLILDNPKKI